MLITRRAEFSASHVCRDPRLSDEANRAIYGLEANPHGHNYVLEVTLEGEPDPVTGMVVDLKHVKDVLNREVLEPIDHRFLNCEVSPFQTVVPTVENVALALWRRLEAPLTVDGVRLHAVRLYETEDLFVDYFGEEP
jgi:6-pyruvoyltetrahydropterin/6-carboxytetrahydropterin synthase